MLSHAVGRNFAGRLWREAYVNYISCSARQVLMNPEEMTLVLRDWEKVDFNYALASISWLCGTYKSAPHTIHLLSAGNILPAHSPLIHCYLW
jgi:hypothetical protein